MVIIYNDLSPASFDPASTVASARRPLPPPLLVTPRMAQWDGEPLESFGEGRVRQ